MISELQSASAWNWSSVANPKDATFRDLFCLCLHFPLLKRNRNQNSVVSFSFFKEIFVLKCIINKRMDVCEGCKLQICCFIYMLSI